MQTNLFVVAQRRIEIYQIGFRDFDSWAQVGVGVVLVEGDEGVHPVVAAFELNKHQYTVFYTFAGREDTRHFAVGEWPQRMTVDYERRYARGGEYFEKIASFHFKKVFKFLSAGVFELHSILVKF